MNSLRATKDLRHETRAALRLSQRAVLVQPQPMFRILAEAMQIESLGHPVIHLEIGDTSSLTSPELTRRLREDKHVTASLGYSPSAGEPVLRDVLARHYSRDLGVSIRRENVVITPANAAITQLIGILCDEGDAVLLPDPAFSTYQLAARYNSVNEVFFPLREAAGFAPNIAEIRTRMDANPRIRALILDNPSNPLGIAHAPSIIDAIAAECESRGIALIWDQTYKNLNYSGESMCLKHRGTNLYVYSLSKDAAAPALRVGCVVGDAEVVGKVADYNSLFYSCLPKPLQLLAASYLEGVCREHAAGLAHIIKGRIEVVTAILRPSPWLSFVTPNASIYAYLNVSRAGLDGEAFANRLLHERMVCVCPGAGFGPSGRDYVRICLSGKEEELYEGCRALVDFAAAVGAENTGSPPLD